MSFLTFKDLKFDKLTSLYALLIGWKTKSIVLLHIRFVLKGYCKCPKRHGDKKSINGSQWFSKWGVRFSFRKVSDSRLTWNTSGRTGLAGIVIMWMFEKKNVLVHLCLCLKTLYWHDICHWTQALTTRSEVIKVFNLPSNQQRRNF